MYRDKFDPLDATRVVSPALSSMLSSSIFCTCSVLFLSLPQSSSVLFLFV